MIDNLQILMRGYIMYMKISIEKYLNNMYNKILSVTMVIVMMNNKWIDITKRCEVLYDGKTCSYE